MKYNKIKKIFLNFFKKKQHKIFKSLSIINKDKSNLMFINSGINQFKNYFLKPKKIKFNKIANIQKCIRISGKISDLNKVGKDNYHHTMFEMLGNWSIGAYNIQKAIKYAWILITKIYKISKKRIFITVFKGDKNYKIKKDTLSYKCWKKLINKKRIFFFGKKKNFWKIDNFDLCGPCTEIYVDIRSKKEIKNKPIKNLINKNQLIELWNIVNIKYLIKNKKIYKNKNYLSNNFIDTGMGFERLCMILQKKKSTFDIDIFKLIIKKIESIFNIKYKKKVKHDVVIKIVADHIRSILIIIYYGILPNNTKYGYVLRKLIRRSLIYVYKYLNYKKPFLYKLVKITYKTIFNKKDKKKIINIKNIIKKEEIFYFNNLKHNLVLMSKYLKKNKIKYIDKNLIFFIYSTFGINYFFIKKYAKKKNIKIFKNKIIEI
ncbi:MAG: alanine--tRNA ligase-related protein [Candidatus Shikimatogenerans bostrichidophilus]|nr:MAG: alanine--tRNA ligase-related protein [Candidatus Shikimatogenerans bostrichidophilus]